MPWKETCPMDERLKFVGQYLKGEMSVAGLCESYGISRKTGHKWLKRYVDEGVIALVDRSRRPRNSPFAVSDAVLSIVVECRKKHPTWGPRKLLLVLAKEYPGLRLPAASTVSTILSRHGL